MIAVSCGNAIVVGAVGRMLLLLLLKRNVSDSARIASLRANCL